MKNTKVMEEEAYDALVQEVGQNPSILSLVERLAYIEGREGNAEREAIHRLLGRVAVGTYPTGLCPHNILQLLMEERGLRQADLIPMLGTHAQVSLIVTGKGGITKDKARALGEYFGVSPVLFL
jgi:HTH-type transcriptional regulator/antitoxin HigA